MIRMTLSLLILILALPLAAQRRPARPSRTPASTSTPAAARPAMAGEVAKPDGARMSATQQQNIDTLTSDLAAIKSGSSVTQKQKQALASDLMAMADGATKPDQALVQSLSTDLSDAMIDGELSSREMAKLAADLEAVMNSASVPASEVNKAIADARAILASSGVDSSDVQTIVGDLKAIAAEAQKHQP